MRFSGFRCGFCEVRGTVEVQLNRPLAASVVQEKS
jgi:hypothetical protein